MVLALTGHRPNKLDNEYDYKLPLSTIILNELQLIIKNEKCDKIITGMALGCDTIWAISALKMEIPVIAAIPFIGQEKIWIKESQDLYNKILNYKTVEKHIVCEGGYAVWKLQKRNIWMVDHCDKLVAVWDGSEGGTNNCIKYAKSIGKEIIYLDLNELKRIRNELDRI